MRVMPETRTLFLIRHAKSSWKEAGLDDMERPLNNRGKTDAPRMGKHLAKYKLKPEVFISSPAERAYKTAVKICRALNYKKSDIRIDERIYSTGAMGLFEVLRNIDDTFKTAAVVGHNPDITHLVNKLSNSEFENVPTCAVAVIRFKADSWNRIQTGKGKLVDYFIPKNLPV